MSGLKINFSKSEVLLLNGDDNLSLRYAELFNCQIGSFPIRYLGVPVSPSRLHIKDWTMLEEKNDKKLAIWKGKFLSIAGRTTLIDSSLSNSFVYHMSIYLLPKTTTDRLDRQRRTFFWQGGSHKRKYHLVRWEIINKSKKYGGLGIKNIQLMNISLLCKWWWKLETGTGLWQEIVKMKYMQGETVSSVKHRLNNSPVWNDLLKIKPIYLMGRSLIAKNGRKTSLWLDSWLHNRPLSFSAPVLFDLCCEKNISVHSFLAKQGQLHFSRWFPHVLFEQWLGIINSVYNHPFVNSEDTPVWAWNKNKNFSSQSVYNFLTKENSRKHLKHVWKAKIPYKIKFFLWLVENNAILTKDNLIKRHWTGSPTCHFCLTDESVEHLFFQCPVARVTWGIIGICLGATDIPANLHQYKLWIKKWLPGGDFIYTSGCAAVCWAI